MNLTLAQSVAAFGHDLRTQGFDPDFVRDAQLIALDRVMQIEDGLSLSREAVDVATSAGPNEESRGAGTVALG